MLGHGHDMIRRRLKIALEHETPAILGMRERSGFMHANCVFRSPAGALRAGDEQHWASRIASPCGVLLVDVAWCLIKP